MNLIPTAYAAAVNDVAPPNQGGSIWTTVIMLAVFFAIFYFLLIRPQSKRAKEHRNLLASVAVGDEVVTSSGLMGKVTALNDNTITIEIAPNVNIRMQKSAISGVLPKGSLEKA